MITCIHPKVDETPVGMAHALGRIEGTLAGVTEYIDDHEERIGHVERRRTVTWTQFGVVLTAIFGSIRAWSVWGGGT